MVFWVYAWLISLSITSPRFIYLCQNFLCFQVWVIFHYMCISHFVYPFICQWTFGLFSSLVFVNHAAMNMGVQISVVNSFVYIPKMELSDHMVIIHLIFWGLNHTLSHSNCNFLYSHQQCTRFQFIHIFTMTYCFLFCCL